MASPILIASCIAHELPKFKIGMRTNNKGDEVYNVNGSCGFTWIELEFGSMEDAIAARDAMNKCTSDREL